MHEPLVFDETASRAEDEWLVETRAAPSQGADLLRFVISGSVDDGKSTLLGRLLYDSQRLRDDELANLVKDSARYGSRGDEIDFALLVDGLAAEREQGITIDVAYRYFATRRRSFIVADTPGHEQYTRNMATGASTADVAVILLDARKGLTAQTRRHLFIVSMLGIRRVVIAVNKMDLVAFARERFDLIADQCRQMTDRLDFSKSRLRSGFGNLGRQHRQRLARDAVVSRTYAAAPARDRPRRRGTHERFVSFPGPVGDAAQRGFPRIWRDDRKRFGRARRPG